jgi:hypothetical protein
MKNITIVARVLSKQLILLLLLSATIFDSPKPASGQSRVSDEVKRDTQGQTIKQGQALHIDVNLALVNVTVTDPIAASSPVSSQMTSASLRTTSSRRW